MGYKLAGFDVLGGVEIDPRMSALYVANLKPKYEFLESVVDFVARDDASLPTELFSLDLFDGSPPCSTFSVAGKRAKLWGKEKHFREGQAEQVLDSLPMAWVACVLKLRPRVAIMENVVGMVLGDAKGFVREVVAALAPAYDAQTFRLDASRMGVPQKRERIFVIARRRDLEFAPLRLAFNEMPIACVTATASLPSQFGRMLGGKRGRNWFRVPPGETFNTVDLVGGMFTHRRLNGRRPACTLTSSSDVYHWSEPRTLTPAEYRRLQSFPDDYDFGAEQAGYVCGMSVPPLMTQRLALEIRKQWLG